VTWVRRLYHLSNRIRKWLHVLYFFIMITCKKTLFTSLGVLCAAHKKIHCSVAVICVQVEGVQSDWRKNNQHVLYELGHKLLSLAKSYSKRHCPLVVCFFFSTLSLRYLFVLAEIIHTFITNGHCFCFTWQISTIGSYNETRWNVNSVCMTLRAFGNHYQDHCIDIVWTK